jgi:hypothetical protein
MAFYKRNTEECIKDQYGRLYVLRFELDSGEIVWKVGMCNTDRTLDRMMEVLRSFFKVYRYVPRVTLRKDKKVVTPLLVEQYMHGLLEEYAYTFDKKFDGSTEFFTDLDESLLLDFITDFSYGDLLASQGNSMKTVDYEMIREEMALIRSCKPRLASSSSDELPF